MRRMNNPSASLLFFLKKKFLLTVNGGYRATASVPVHYRGVTLNPSLRGEVAAVAAVCDPVILEHFDGCLYSIDCVPSVYHDCHSCSACTKGSEIVSKSL